MEAEIKNPIVRFVIYGHIWLVLGAMAQVWWVGQLLHSSADATMIAFVGLASFAAYGVMRLLRMNAVALSGSAMMVWYRANARMMRVLVGVAALASILVGWPMHAIIIHALWLPGLFAAFYIVPLGLTRQRPSGLRRIPMLKAFIIAFVWACVVVVLPGTSELNDGAFISLDVWLTAIVWACYFLALAISFDIRDLPYDLPSLRTIPQVFGAPTAKVIAVLLLLPMVVMLGVMVLIGDDTVDLPQCLPVLGLLLTGVLIARSGPQRPWWFYSLLLDGTMILIPVLWWIGSAI